jgi:hypothetical protein
VDVPGELLADDADARRLGLGRELVDPRRPEGHGEAEQQDRFRDHHRDLDVARRVALHAVGVGDRVRRGAELDEREHEVDRPADEQHAHQQMDVPGEAVEVPAVRRSELGEVENLLNVHGRLSSL